jgi:hypothetical protein
MDWRIDAKGMKGFAAVDAKEQGIRGSTATAGKAAIHPSTKVGIDGS